MNPGQHYCRDCDGVHPDTRGDEPWRWRCLRNPRPPGYEFVDPEYSPHPPFATCKETNYDGFCKDFQPQPAPAATDEPKTRQFVRRRRELSATRT